MTKLSINLQLVFSYTNSDDEGEVTDVRQLREMSPSTLKSTCFRIFFHKSFPFKKFNIFQSTKVFYVKKLGVKPPSLRNWSYSIEKLRERIQKKRIQSFFEIIVVVVVEVIVFSVCYPVYMSRDSENGKKYAHDDCRFAHQFFIPSSGNHFVYRENQKTLIFKNFWRFSRVSQLLNLHQIKAFFTLHLFLFIKELSL